MKVKVINRENPGIYKEYNDVDTVVDTFDDNRNLCHQIKMKDNTTATYPACEWAFFELTWKTMF